MHRILPILRILSVLLSALLLGAHFLRAGAMGMVLLSLGFPAMLLIRRTWANG